MHPTVVKLISTLFPYTTLFRSQRLHHDRRELPLRLVDADPELLWMEIRNDRRHASEMVGVRVSDYHGVEAIDAAIPQIRRDDLFSDVEVGVHPLRQAAGINQHRAALRRDEQNGVALPDVDGGHLHYARTDVRDRKSTRLNSSHLGISYAV